MLTCDDIPDPPDCHMGKPSFNRFHLRFPAYHKKVKSNKNQSIITKKINLIFWKKVTTDCDHDETLAETKGVLSDMTRIMSKLIGMKFRKLPGDIIYLTFPIC